MSEEGRITVWSHPGYENLVAEFQIDGTTVIVTQGEGPDDFEIVIESNQRQRAKANLKELETLINEAKRRLAELGWKAGADTKGKRN